MNDQRKAGRARGRDVIAEAPLLRITRAEVVMIVEAGYADRDSLRMLGEAHDLLDADIELLVGVVRMCADRAEHVGIALRDGKKLGAPVHPRRDRHHAPYPSRARSADDDVELAAEVGEVEMAVTVDQHDHACAALST